MLPVRYTRTPAVPSFHISYKYNDCAPILTMLPGAMSFRAQRQCADVCMWQVA